MRWTGYLHDLERQTGLRLPSANISILGCAGLVLVLIAGVTGAAGLIEPRLLWAAELAGFLVAAFAPKTLPRKARTLRHLARAAAGLNPAALAARGGRLRRGDLWQRMAEILCVESRLAPAELGMDTTLFPNGGRRAYRPFSGEWFGHRLLGLDSLRALDPATRTP